MEHATLRAHERYLLLANIAHVTYDGLHWTTWRIESLEAVSPRAFEHILVGAEVRNHVASKALGNERKVASV